MEYNNFEIDFSEDLCFDNYREKGFKALDFILNKNGLGNKFLGWVTHPEVYDREEYSRMKNLSEKVKKAEVLVVVGVGGSFLGSKAVIKALKPYFKQNGLDIVFAGNNLSGDYLSELVDYIKDKDFYINVISKSGSTFETAIAFRVLKELCEEKYGKESVNRIIVTTDSKKGILKEMSEKVGYETFCVPDDIGGRFSVLTAVGLFPIMCAEIDTDAILLGANDGLEEYTKKSLNNVALKYAIIRNVMFEDEKKEIEYLVAHEFKLSYFQEWWKQLFAESEGKNGKGLYVESAIFTRDLHSFGQMIQDGNKITFETIIEVENLKNDIIIPFVEDDFDKLNYLSKKSLNDINKVAVTATRKAHTDGKVPTVKIKIPRLDAYNIGKLIYFFEMSCAISAYMLGVNPFDQPGVDNYKKNMYQLLEKM